MSGATALADEPPVLLGTFYPSWQSRVPVDHCLRLERTVSNQQEAVDIMVDNSAFESTSLESLAFEREG